MKLLARLIVSIQLFWTNPSRWWSRLPVIFKFGLLIGVIPAVSVGTTLFFQSRTGASPQQLTELAARQQVELAQLKQELASLRALQESLADKTLGTNTLGASAAAAVRSRVQASLNPVPMSNTPSVDVSSISPVATASGSAYVLPGSASSVKLYQKPDAASSVVTTIRTDAWFKLLKRQEGWMQLQLEDKRTGWIPEELVLATN